MNNLLNIQTPAEQQASELRSDFGLKNHGFSNLRKAYWNLPTEALYEEIIFRGEGKLSHQGPVVVNTGKHTARAANDKFIVREPETEEHVWWGEYNRPFDADKFEVSVMLRLQGFLQGRDLFIQDCYGGADQNYQTAGAHNYRICLAQSCLHATCSSCQKQMRNIAGISRNLQLSASLPFKPTPRLMVLRRRHLSH